MRRVLLILAALAAWTAAAATPNRTATEAFVTNKIAAAVAALPAPDLTSATNYTDEATNKLNVSLSSQVSRASRDATNYTDEVVAAAATAATNYTDAATNALDASLTSQLSRASRDATNYTDEATSALARVAHTGSYNDLSNKPSIPTVPTNVSAFSNDAGYLTGYTETDPTISAWAKAANKPTYTASEVGATTPADVTAAIREQSLGGIWDSQLEVWWTPRMRSGSLTYEATTNVNLNAVN